ncbi:5'-adenylylsulfate reductase-like 4 [Orobanche gracilis]
MAAVFGTGLVLFFLLGSLKCEDLVRVSLPPAVCSLNSVKDIIFASQNDVCSVCETGFSHTTCVIEGDEATLQKALNVIHKNEHDYVSLLFYSSWPSILSKYGVHGFPSLILLNSTMRMRYQGSRTLDSLISFYDEFTGIKVSADRVSKNKIICSGCDENDDNNQETCPFPWAKSPENLFQQETYLTMATLFVILRLLYFFYPTLRKWAQLAWRRYTVNVSVNGLWELNQVMQLFSFLKEPYKKSNLQEGAKNAKAWASKSLATVTFGDASSCRDA